MDSKHSLPELVEILEYANYISIREREEIAELIQQQEKMIELAVKRIVYTEGTCPGDLFSFDNNCLNDCHSDGEDTQCADCWRKYLQGEVSK